jgi:hypothetical protein
MSSHVSLTCTQHQITHVTFHQPPFACVYMPQASMRRQFTPNGAKDTSTGHDTGRKLVPTSSMPGDLAAYHHSSASLSPAARDRGRDLAGGNMTTYDFYSTNRPPNNYPAAVTGSGGPGVAVPAKHAPFHANPRTRPYSQVNMHMYMDAYACTVTRCTKSCTTIQCTKHKRMSRVCIAIHTSIHAPHIHTPRHTHTPRKISI